MSASSPNLPNISSKDFTVGEYLGEGGFADVYKGKWNGREVAIKKLLLKKIPVYLAKDFENEIKIMAQCSACPQIVKLLAVCTEVGQNAMIMEFIERGSLFDILQNEDIDLPWESLRFPIAIDVGKGLSYLHDREILHRDLKSHNILLGPNFEAKISDFGLSKLKLESSSHSKEKKSVGTVRWKAPELLSLKPNYSKASDIYAYGMVLWEIASRTLPFADAIDSVIISNVENGAQETIPEDCSPEYGKLVQSTWTKDPNKRPSVQYVVLGLEKLKPKPAPKSWYFDPETKLDADVMGKEYVLLDASAKDVEKVARFYLHHPIPGYEIASVKVVYNPTFNRSFEAHMKKLQKRDGNPFFDPKWSMNLLDQQLGWREKVAEMFEEMAKPYTDPDYPNVKLLPLWHGTNGKAVESICQVGYANPTATDAGFFGRGLYGAHEAAYPYRVYSKGAFFLNWVAIYSAYPVVRGDEAKLEGRGNFENYDAHFIPVVPRDRANPHEVNYDPCKPFDQHTYSEVVVFESAACLPRYLVELKPMLTKAILPSSPPERKVTARCLTTYSIEELQKLEILPNGMGVGIIGSDYEEEVKLIDLTKGRATTTLREGVFSRLNALSTGNVLVGDYDYTYGGIKLILINPTQGEVIMEFDWMDAVNSLEILPDGKLAIIGRLNESDNPKVMIFETGTGKCLYTLGHDLDLKETRGSYLKSFPGAGLAKYSKTKGQIEIWNLASKSIFKTLDVQLIGPFIPLSIEALASCSEDNTIKIWNFVSGKLIGTLKGHTDEILALTLLNDSILASVAKDKTIKFWDIKNGNLMLTLNDQQDSLGDLKLLPNGYLLSRTKEMIKIWQIDVTESPAVPTSQPPKPSRPLPSLQPSLDPMTSSKTIQATGPVQSLLVLPNGNLVTSESSTEKGTSVCIRNPLTGEIITSFHGNIGEGYDTTTTIELLTVLSDGKLLLLYSHSDFEGANYSLEIIDLKSGKKNLDPLANPRHGPLISFLYPMPNGSFFSSFTSPSWRPNLEAHQIVHRNQLGETLQTIPVSTEVLCRLSETLIAFEASNTISLWDLKKGKSAQKLQGHTDEILFLEPHAKESLLSGSKDKTIKLWQPLQGKLLRTFEGHSSPISALASFPDGRFASGAEDGMIVIWNAETGKILNKLREHKAKITGLKVLKDGYLVSSSEDGTLKFWK